MRKVFGLADVADLWTLPGRGREFGGRTNSTMSGVLGSQSGLGALVRARFRRNGLDFVGQCLQVDGPVVEADLPGTVDPDQRVLHPILVVPIGVVLTRLRPAALFAVRSRMNRRRCL